MKKTSAKRKSILVLAGMLLALLLVGCGSTSVPQHARYIQIDSDEANPYVTVVDVQNAWDDAFISTTREIFKDEPLVVDSDISEGGSIEVQLVAIDDPAKEESSHMDEMVDPELAAFDQVFTGTESLEISLPTGSYYLNAIADEGTTGTVSIRFPEEVYWEEAVSSEDAAQRAGLDGFVAPAGLMLSSGVIGTDSPYAYYSCMPEIGFVQARYLLENGDQLDICKAGAGKNADIFGTEQNNDYVNDEFSREYPYEWTRTIGDVEVTCYGNVENETAKAIWSIGDSNYALVIWDWNRGTAHLSDEDLDILVGAIR